MKNILLLLCLSVLTLAVSAQTNVELRINHMLGTNTFQMNSTAQNDLGQDFQVTRLQYYLTRITVVHDGGQNTPVSDDTLALINAADGPFTTIPLGNLNVTSVEGVKFHIGVYAPINNADPSLQPASHPLAPQSPSMHWGWASGYRFLAFEGISGSGFSQIFQLHGLDNSNYFETTVAATGQTVMGTLIIAVDADYAEGLSTIDVAGGVISHGSTGEALTGLQNFNTKVFSPSSQTIGIEESTRSVEWTVYPNPAQTGDVFLNLQETSDNAVVDVYNSLGQKILDQRVTSGINKLPIDVKGSYVVRLSINGQIVDNHRLVVQ